MLLNYAVSGNKYSAITVVLCIHTLVIPVIFYIGLLLFPGCTVHFGSSHFYQHFPELHLERFLLPVTEIQSTPDYAILAVM
jgi:hypothetical protein